MADEPGAEPEPQPQVESESEGEPTVSELDNRMDRVESGLAEVLAFLKGGAPKADPDPEPVDIKRQVREAVREVQAADGAKAAKAEEDRSLREQVGQLKAALEKPPEEFRRVTQRMGWNRP